ncbi:hypothetical protein [Desulfobacula sp.]|uniref:hypothetical protein n=1 Tax=Desulfobacula sp. TaxID=2593537 RepID=UPI0025C09A6E|nr:hypothetical protein [Desulfobacula sp.]MBC2704253.1 hypothetical protein [Desulfobacula sp.]
MPVEACGLVKVVDIACSGFLGSLCFSVLERQDIFYAIFHCGEINAACAVVMACGKCI